MGIHSRRGHHKIVRTSSNEDMQTEWDTNGNKDKVEEREREKKVHYDLVCKYKYMKWFPKILNSFYRYITILKERNKRMFKYLKSIKLPVV